MPEIVSAYEIALRQQSIASIARRGIADGDDFRNDRIAALKREIHQIERIRNRKIVVDEDVLITGYRPSRREQRRCLRRLRDKASRLRKRH